MFRKALIAAATLAVTAGSIAATTGTASAHGYRWSNHHNNYQRIVCQPVFEWKRVWNAHLYRYVTIRVKVDENCYRVGTPRYNRWY
jgi:Spy/CpxP family protein refolding chaperone